MAGSTGHGHAATWTSAGASHLAPPSAPPPSPRGKPQRKHVPAGQCGSGIAPRPGDHGSSLILASGCRLLPAPPPALSGRDSSRRLPQPVGWPVPGASQPTASLDAPGRTGLGLSAVGPWTQRTCLRGRGREGTDGGAGKATSCRGCAERAAGGGAPGARLRHGEQQGHLPSGSELTSLAPGTQTARWTELWLRGRHPHSNVQVPVPSTAPTPSEPQGKLWHRVGPLVTAPTPLHPQGGEACRSGPQAP